jgi:hypothetical protein
MQSNYLSGSLFSAFNRCLQGAEEEAEMGILILKILLLWSVAGFATGLALGAIIRRAERARSDKYLSCVFASVEIMQASRS